MNIPEIMKMTPNKHDIQFINVQQQQQHILYFSLRYKVLYNISKGAKPNENM